MGSALRRLAPALVATLVAACAPLVAPPSAPPATTPSDFPEALYQRAAERGEPVFRVDPAGSLIVIHAFRGGTLARFGHDHAIASRDVRGYVLLPDVAGTARADLYVPLESLTVDEPALRAAAGFDTQPSQQDIDGTRRNMLDKVLEVGRYPFAVLHLARPDAQPPQTVLHAEVTLHGVTRTLAVDAEIDRSAAGMLIARGRFSLDQSDFGIRPFSVLGGALQVQNRIDVQFAIEARPLGAPTASAATAVPIR